GEGAVAGLAVLVTVAAAGAAWVLLPRFLPLIEGAGLVRSNFRGQPVPAAAGTALALIYGASLLALVAAGAWRGLPRGEAGLGGGPPDPVLVSLFVVTAGMALVGLADDVFGDRTATGLGGHWRRLLSGRVTTGALKALFGGIVGLAAGSLLAETLVDLIANALLIPLLANAVNLLDVRPGRAVKGFFGAIGLFWIAAPGHPGWPYVAPLLAAVAVYLPYDLQARAMLGDTGANLLGGVAGVAAAAALSPLARAALLAVLLAVHVLAEQRSLSDVIERVPPLHWLDRWGRE